MRAARLGQATGAAPPGGPGPRHRHGPDPGPGSGQVQPEIPALPVLLEPLSMDGVVVTADAMHTQVDTAQWITRRGGHYLLTPLGNQKTLHRTLKDLPWRKVPSVSSVDSSRGRRVRRTVKAVEAPAWVDFPAAAQVLQVRRTRTIKGRKHVEVAYPGLLTAHGAGPARAGRRLDPQALENREPAPLDQRRHLRRGPPPTAHPQRPRDHSRTTQPDHPTSSTSSTPPYPYQDDPHEPSDYSPNQSPKPSLPTSCGGRRVVFMLLLYSEGQGW